MLCLIIIIYLKFFKYYVFLGNFTYISFPILGDIGNFYFGKPSCPMKPQRIRMTHHLILRYNLYRKMEVYVSSLFIITFYICKKHNFFML